MVCRPRRLEHLGVADAGTIRTTAAEHFGITRRTSSAHALLETGKARGKIVLEGFPTRTDMSAELGLQSSDRRLAHFPGNGKVASLTDRSQRLRAGCDLLLTGAAWLFSWAFAMHNRRRAMSDCRECPRAF